MFAVVVTLKIAEGAMADFLPLMQTNAQASLHQEPGCQQFDVCTDPGRPGEVFLYELYADHAAFDAHLASAHFQTFDAATAAMIADKDVRTFSEVAG